jgi:acyl dehydratase
MADPLPGSRFELAPFGPITRGALREYALASGDRVRLHIDAEYARGAGWPDVIAHGMLSMAFLGQLLTTQFSLRRLRSWRVRFVAVTPLDAIVRCCGEVIGSVTEGGKGCLRIRVWCELPSGVRTVEGDAIAELLE